MALIYKTPMRDESWKARLKAAIEADGRDMKAISAAAGLGQNYVQQLLRNDKIPKIDSLAKICGALNVTPSYIMTGHDVSPDDQAFLSAWLRLSPETRRHFYALLQSYPPDDEPAE